MHVSQGLSKAKNLSLSTLRYGRERNKRWCVGNTGEELVPTGEAAFVVLCRGTGWSTQFHMLMRGKHKGHWRLKDAFSPPELALRHHPIPSPVNTHKQSIQKTTSTYFVCLHNTDASNKCTSILSCSKFAAARRASPREAPTPISRRHIRKRQHISMASLKRLAGFIRQHLHE